MVHSSKDGITKKTWTRDEILKTISNVARIDLSQITDNTLIRDELGIDSIMGIEIIAMIEIEFNIEINEAVLLNMKTVGNFIEIIEEFINKQHGEFNAKHQ